ncbi:MAG: hypothetical protein M3Z54_11535, partial [Gemmatimonadota bacterium]|nr:hypothetical protein [Gemmatimonadota bacterium]
MRGFQVVLSALTLAGCASFPIAQPNVQSDWDRTLYYARLDVEAGNYFAADRLLDEFIRVHPDSRQSKESAFWKAIYTLDPANERGSLPAGINALDQYLASTDSTAMYRNEALVLRRTAASAQGVTAATGTQRPAGTSSVAGSADTVVVTRSRDEEIASLKEQLAKSKEELAKVSAELDRIKKRLANPSN